MGRCIPAEDVLAASKAVRAHNASISNVTSFGGPTSVWGPPNLPAPAVSYHHPVHAVNIARSASITPVSKASTPEPEKPSPTGSTEKSTDITTKTIVTFKPSDSTATDSIQTQLKEPSSDTQANSQSKKEPIIDKAVQEEKIEEKNKKIKDTPQVKKPDSILQEIAKQPTVNEEQKKADDRRSDAVKNTPSQETSSSTPSPANDRVKPSPPDQEEPKAKGSTTAPKQLRQTADDAKQPVADKPEAEKPIRPPDVDRRQISRRQPKPIPQFFFPSGTSRMTKEEAAFELNRVKQELTKLAEPMSSSSKKVTSPSPELMLPHSSFGSVAKALNCPFYWKYAIYHCCGGGPDKQPIALSSVLKCWSQVIGSCPDEHARFVHLLTKGQSYTLQHSDFNPLIQDILDSHPGLAFLQSAQDFHLRYVTTVVSRIFFNVNASWSGKISLAELRRSNFLSVLASLESEDDINLVTQYFSYEHFYVIYCKFWELDEDHDLIISRADLARHNNYAISEKMIDRIFSGSVTRGNLFKENLMSYQDFVWFLLADEDKRHPRSIEYWFRCMDIDGDGLLSMYELEYFYSEQLIHMEEMGIDAIPFEDCLCQCLDMVKPELRDKIRLADLKRSRMCHVFFDTFFNLPKYLQYEQRDPFSNQRYIDGGLNELSDWDRYAGETYEMLVAVDVVNPEDDDDDDEEDEVREERHPGLGSDPSKADAADSPAVPDESPAAVAVS